ncbi:MAG: nickel pincer cofactor biosynthesis protein LarB [Dongiaceae bacterium]
MKGFEIDWDRERRTRVVEALLCEGKSSAQIVEILGSAKGRRMLLTRLAAEVFDELPTELRSALDYEPLSRTAILGEPPPQLESGIGIVCAGTSDLPVGLEAARTLAFHGHACTLIADVGVAGLWRLLRRLDEIRGFSVVIAVAGMEGALFSVLAGLVDSPIVAVPTSVGYGVGAGGQLALNAALAGCGPGLTTVNIDNGFGAACAAGRMRRHLIGYAHTKPNQRQKSTSREFPSVGNAVRIGPSIWIVDTGEEDS